MPICTQCGVVLAMGDDDKHVCNPADVPPKGKMKKPNMTLVDAV